MKKWQGIAASSAILLAAAVTFSFPIQKTNRFPFRMLPSSSAMIAHAPKSAGETVTHLVLDSAVDEGDGSVNVGKFYYNEKGQLDSIVGIEEGNTPYMRATYYHSTNDGIDSMLNQNWGDSGWVNESKWFFTIPLDANIFPDLYDRLTEGPGMGVSPSYLSFELAAPSCNGMVWDSTKSEWLNYEKDTVIDGNNGTKIFFAYNWDTLSGSWQPGQIDTFFFSEDNVLQMTMSFRLDTTWYRYRYSFIYDKDGMVTEYSNETWHSIDKMWEQHTKQKYSFSFNSHSHIDTFRVQYWDSFTESWTSIDSGSYAICSYIYDTSGNITTRSDSSLDRLYGDTIPSKVTHYFKYQTFSSPVIPRKAIKSRPNSVVSVSSDGRIKLQSLSDKNLSATLCTLSGRSLCRIPLRSDIRLNDYCAKNDIHPGSGVCLLRVKSDKTGLPIGEWKVFFR